MLEIPLAHFIDAQNWSVYRNPHSSMSYTPQIVSRWSVKHSISTACTVYKALLPLSEVFGFCQNFCQHWVKAILYVLAEFNFWIPIFDSTAAKATFRLVRYYPWADFREVQGNQADSTCSFSLRIIYHRFPPENLVVQDPQQWGCTRPSAVGLCNMVRDMKIFHILQARLSLALSMKVKRKRDDNTSHPLLTVTLKSSLVCVMSCLYCHWESTQLSPEIPCSEVNWNGVKITLSFLSDFVSIGTLNNAFLPLYLVAFRIFTN